VGEEGEGWLHFREVVIIDRSGNLFPTPQERSQHMFCVPKSDPLLSIITGDPFLLTPTATASVISGGMKSDWKFVLTSEI
jgi:hypothetical protein